MYLITPTQWGLVIARSDLICHRDALNGPNPDQVPKQIDFIEISLQLFGIWGIMSGFGLLKYSCTLGRTLGSSRGKLFDSQLGYDERWILD